MAKGKKTIEVSMMLDWANSQLERTDEWADIGFKIVICTMVERILFNTKNYNGFGFIDNNDSETGTLGYYSRFYYENK
jgi:hypothetical protein